ncbi:MAG: LuxR family transcriptional regulator [Pseudomonadota bacterium]|jgi:LuxR family quorum sensing-dependent transcriptional regulator
MLRHQFAHFTHVLAAVEHFEQARTSSALVDCIRTAAAVYGYEMFVIAAAPSAARSEFDQLVLLRHWPEDWFRQDVHDRLLSHDLLVAQARERSRAFAWRDVSWPSDAVQTTRLMEIASRDYGMRQGFCVPIYGIYGYEGAVSFAGREVDNSPSANAGMELLALYAVNQLMRLRSEEKAARAVLSAREREVLTWAAIGKTAWDTGCILSISTDTVNKHMASAMRKLKAYTKTQAVAESLRRGEIHL